MSLWTEVHQQGALHDIVGKSVPCRTVTDPTGHSISPTDLPVVAVAQPEAHNNKVMGSTLPTIGDIAGLGDMDIMDGTGTTILITSVKVMTNGAANMMSELTLDVIVSVLHRTVGNVHTKGVTGKVISFLIVCNANMRRHPGEAHSQVLSLQEINDTKTLVNEITISRTRRQQ